MLRLFPVLPVPSSSPVSFVFCPSLSCVHVVFETWPRANTMKWQITQGTGKGWSQMRDERLRKVKKSQRNLSYFHSKRRPPVQNEMQCKPFWGLSYGTKFISPPHCQYFYLYSLTLSILEWYIFGYPQTALFQNLSRCVKGNYRPTHQNCGPHTPSWGIKWWNSLDHKELSRNGIMQVLTNI